MNHDKVDALLTQSGCRFEFLHDKDYEDFSPYNFAELIIQECIHLCAETEASYSLIRRMTSDFSEKNIFAEGEVAARVVATKIKQHFAVE